jgi:hypothetical protein
MIYIKCNGLGLPTQICENNRNNTLKIHVVVLSFLKPQKPGYLQQNTADGLSLLVSLSCDPKDDKVITTTDPGLLCCDIMYFKRQV